MATSVWQCQRQRDDVDVRGVTTGHHSCRGELAPLMSSDTWKWELTHISTLLGPCCVMTTPLGTLHLSGQFWVKEIHSFVLFLLDKTVVFSFFSDCLTVVDYRYFNCGLFRCILPEITHQMIYNVMVLLKKNARFSQFWSAVVSPPPPSMSPNVVCTLTPPSDATGHDNQAVFLYTLT